MKNKRKMLIIMIIISIILIVLISLSIYANNKNNTFNEPFTISAIDASEGDNYRIADSLNIDNEVFPVLISDYKPINEWSGNDENGNKCTILNYNPYEISEMDMGDFADVIINYSDYFELENDSNDNETVLIARAKDPENILVISMYHNEEKAYIKYTICKASSMDLTKLGDYYEIFMSEEL